MFKSDKILNRITKYHKGNDQKPAAIAKGG